jgi:hypothetical protein
MRHQSLISIANRHVSFPQAAQLVGVGWGVTRDRGSKVHCPFSMLHADGGRAPALRIWTDHGWCFAETRWFSPVSLVAAVRELDAENAAKWLLDKVGYVPVTYAHLWEHAQRTRDLGKSELAAALSVWCAANCPDWQVRQYEPVVAERLSRCLSLLALVHTSDDCLTWLSGCKHGMRQVLGLAE